MRVMVSVGSKARRFVHVNNVFIIACVVGLAGGEIVICTRGFGTVFVALPELVGFTAAVNPSPLAFHGAIGPADPRIVANRGVDQVSHQLVLVRRIGSLPIVR